LKQSISEHIKIEVEHLSWLEVTVKPDSSEDYMINKVVFSAIHDGKPIDIVMGDIGYEYLLQQCASLVKKVNVLIDNIINSEPNYH
jgi:hypothetical protein